MVSKLGGWPKRPIVLVVAICSAVLFVPLFIPLARGLVFTLDDLGAYHIPTRYLYATALRAGNSILWTPTLFDGYYLFGEGQVGMAHPWHLLIYRFLPLPVAFDLEIIASYVVLFAGMTALLKRLEFSREARWFGAMVFTFSGYNLFHLIHVNIIAAVAHIPWILLLVDRLVSASTRRTRARLFICLALLVASQILVGHTQHVWFGLLLVGGLCVYFLWSNVAVARIALVPLAFATGGLIAGVQLLPLFDVAAASQRTDWSPYFSLTFSLLPVNVVQLWAPFTFQNRIRAISIERYAIHEFIVYNGAFCTVALAWLAIRWNEVRRTRVVRILLIVAVVALILAFGRYGGLYAVLASLPGLRWFRAPTRHLMLFHLSISLLAAVAFEDLLEMSRRGERIPTRRLWPLAVPVALSSGTALITFVLIRIGSVEPLSGVRTAIPWLALFAVVSGLFALTASGAKWALPLLALVTALDLGQWGYRYVFGNPFRPMMTVEELARRGRTPEDAKPGDLIERNWEDGLHNVPILRGMRVWPGYVGLIPQLRLTYGPVTTRLAGGKWRLTETETERILNPVPRAQLLTHANVSRNVAADVQSINILAEALVDAPVGELSGSQGTVRILEDRPGRIVLETIATGRQLLMLTERFDEGWQVVNQPLEESTRDGLVSNRRPIAVNGDFLGYVVDSGVHRVTFEFRPQSFRTGLILTGAGTAILLCLLPFGL